MIRDTLFAVFLIIISVIGYIKVNNLSFTSRFFPQMVCIILASLAFIDIISRVAKKLIKKQNIKRENLLKILFYDKAGIVIVLILLYIIILKNLGFIASSILFIGFVSFYIKKTHFIADAIKVFIFSLFVTLFFYFIFYKLFNIQLPRGIIS
ncbi:MAG: tripartite tricarboxylate transporter TctB family protein [Candidatus Bilamarchaeaceae archaeon]